MIIDATCTPADIAYPTDLELADKARDWTEDIFDYLYLTQAAIQKMGSSQVHTVRQPERDSLI